MLLYASHFSSTRLIYHKGTPLPFGRVLGEPVYKENSYAWMVERSKVRVKEDGVTLLESE